jgi:tetratricopeptide (TPR) repeat protein
MADALVIAHPLDAQSWSTRAYARKRVGDLVGAIGDMTRALELEPKEVAYHFTRGRLLAASGQLRAAVEDCTKGLRVGTEYEFDYYKDSLRFLRGYSFLMLGDFEQARADLESVPDDYSLWLNGLQHKEELLRRCGGL